MIILEKPYISDFLLNTIRKNNFPIIENEFTKNYKQKLEKNIIPKEEAIKKLSETKNSKIYTTSENSIWWISKNLWFTNLHEKINIFKNKAKFRKLISEIYPDFFIKR